MPISPSASASRAAPSSAKPATPRLMARSPISSPRRARDSSAPPATTMTSPGLACCRAAWMPLLSPGRVHTVNAGPASFAPGQTAWMAESATPSRSMASPILAAGSLASRSTVPWSGRAKSALVSRAGVVMVGSVEVTGLQAQVLHLLHHGGVLDGLLDGGFELLGHVSREPGGGGVAAG